MDYLELIELRNKYDSTDQAIIKPNIKRYMKESETSYSDLCSTLNISKHTAYSYTNKANNNKPELFNLLILSYYWSINPYDLFE